MKRVELLKGNPMPDELTMLKIGNAHLVGELKAHIAESEKFVLEATAKISELSEANARLKAELWVAKDSQLRTYDGITQKLDALKHFEFKASDFSDIFTFAAQAAASRANDVLIKRGLK